VGKMRGSVWIGLMAFMAVAGARPAAALNDGLARTPPMGWNSWNKFHCNINETIIRQTADAMVSTGLRDAGYVYLTVDDCWSAMSRNSSGNLQSDPTDFPSGMKSLGDYIHARGLKFGIYASIGTATCTGLTPGSLNNETRDVATFASWGADYIKADRCHADGLDYPMIYARWRDAIKASGRPMVLSASVHGFQSPWIWGPGVAHQWRILGDINDSWPRVLSQIDKDTPLAQYAGPGGWNDPDMLEVGNGHMTDTEYRSHFGMWAMLAAPLIAGHDVRSQSAATTTILTHPEVLAVSQDAVGYQARRVSDNGAGLHIYSKVVSGTNVRVAALFNRSDVTANMTVSWSQLSLPSAPATVRDLWARADRGTFASGYTASVPSHGIVIVRVASTSTGPTPTPSPTPTPCATCGFSGYYRITPRHSGKAVVVQSASTANGANVFQWTYGGSATNDEWELRSIGGGYHRVINRHSGKDMVVQSASTAEGANIFQWTYGGTATNDEWAIVSVGSGYYRLTNRNGGKSAEVVGAGTADGADVVQRTYSGGTHQQFQLVSVP